MYDLTQPTFTYAGALLPERKGFTAIQHVAAGAAGFLLGVVCGYGFLLGLGF